MLVFYTVESINQIKPILSAGCIQSVFDGKEKMKNNNEPKLRYPEFTDAWEKCKLGDVIKFINGKAYKQEELLDSGKYRVVRVGNFNTNEHWYYSDLELESDKYMTKGDLLYLWATDFGPRFWNGEKAIFHYHIWRLEVDYKILNKNYLYTWLETDKEKIKQSTNGTTMVHVTKSTMEKRLFLYPTLLEQQKIGNLFKQLDRLITLHKRKWDDVILLKKALLQKMFPKNGERLPEIRFPEFQDNWQLCQLETIVDVYSGRDYKHLSNGDIPVYGTGGYMLSVNEALSYHQDAIGIGRKGTIDKPYILTAPFWTVDTLFYTIPRKNYDLYFTFLLFQLINWKSKDESTGVPSLSKTTILKSLAICPSLPEQQKIGTFFRRLDRLISHHQQQYEHYQLFKKALLQQMFI
ncbi:restriction endonuclease subunit S [Avibacterium paragallinarum]|uniref:restriction endonuclease subunit S n=1 Tax=Avibacterium paragallinarum TaxID=728 RepID=UPI00398587BD